MIVLTTPTGNIGSQVLRRLLARSISPLRLIVRDPLRLPVQLPSDIEIIQGNTNDPAVLRRALKGAKALFWCQPDTPAAENYLQAYEDWSTLAGAAIRESEITHVVAISGAGEKPSVPAGPASGLHRMEEIFSQSPASFRFLRCGSFYSNLLGDWESITRNGEFFGCIPGNQPAPHLAVEDISRVAVDLLSDLSWKGHQALQLLGPHDMSFDEMASELSLKLDRTVQYKQIPAAEFKDIVMQSGMSDSGAQSLLDIAEYLTNHYKTVPGVNRSITPTTFAQWLDGLPPGR